MTLMTPEIADKLADRYAAEAIDRCMSKELVELPELRTLLKNCIALGYFKGAEEATMMAMGINIGE